MHHVIGQGIALRRIGRTQRIAYPFIGGRGSDRDNMAFIAKLSRRYPAKRFTVHFHSYPTAIPPKSFWYSSHPHAIRRR